MVTKSKVQCQCSSNHEHTVCSLVLSAVEEVAAVCSLLPFGASVGPQSEVAVYIREGLPPVLRKLADCIWRWEFLHMFGVASRVLGPLPTKVC